MVVRFAGKVIGKAGRRLREIRRRSGALIRFAKQESKQAKHIGVEIIAADKTIVANALALVQKVANGNAHQILGF